MQFPTQFAKKSSVQWCYKLHLSSSWLRGKRAAHTFKSPQQHRRLRRMPSPSKDKPSQETSPTDMATKDASAICIVGTSSVTPVDQAQWKHPLSQSHQMINNLYNIPRINSQDSLFLSRDVQHCPHRQQQFHMLLTAHERQMASQRAEKQRESVHGQTL